MPQVQLAVSPPPVWDAEIYYPNPFTTNDVGGALSWANDVYAKFPQGNRINSTNWNPQNAASVVGGALTLLSNRNGMRCEVVTGEVAMIVGFPWWNPIFGPATAVNPGGSWVSPISAVAVFDFSVALTGLAFVYLPDTTGYWWLPNNTTGLVPNPRLGVPGGAGPVGGFGWCINDDGTGANGFEFLSCNAAGVVTSRTAAPAGAVADVRDWTHVRVIVQSGDAVNPALVSAEINGAAWVTQAPFDDVSFFRPSTLYPAHATGYDLDRCVGDVGAANPFYSRVTIRYGATLPSGTPAQLP